MLFLFFYLTVLNLNFLCLRLLQKLLCIKFYLLMFLFGLFYVVWLKLAICYFKLVCFEFLLFEFNIRISFNFFRRSFIIFVCFYLVLFYFICILGSNFLYFVVNFIFWPFPASYFWWALSYLLNTILITFIASLLFIILLSTKLIRIFLFTNIFTFLNNCIKLLVLLKSS